MGLLGNVEEHIEKRVSIKITVLATCDKIVGNKRKFNLKIKVGEEEVRTGEKFTGRYQ